MDVEREIVPLSCKPTRPPASYTFTVTLPETVDVESEIVPRTRPTRPPALPVPEKTLPETVDVESSIVPPFCKPTRPPAS